MNQPTKEQMRWFCEQCGLRNLYGRYDTWLYPDGKYGNQPDLDLNNLFKYAVPKLDKKVSGTNAWITGLDITFSYGAHQGGIICGVQAEVLVKDVHNTQYSSITGDPALALFWAIYKAFGGLDDV